MLMVFLMLFSVEPMDDLIKGKNTGGQERRVTGK